MRIVMLLVVTLLAGCGQIGAAGCEAWRPILVGAEDVMTEQTARQILAHNLTGRRICGW